MRLEQRLYCYPRTSRLLKAPQFKSVFDKPDRVFSRQMTLFARKNGLPYSRLGVVITKRRMKKAVSRNQFRRCVREGFRLNQAKFPGFDIVIVANDRTSSLDKQQARACLNELWMQLTKFSASVHAA